MFLSTLTIIITAFTSSAGQAPSPEAPARIHQGSEASASASDAQSVISRHSKEILGIRGVIAMSVSRNGREIDVIVAETTSEIERAVPSKLEGWPVNLVEQDVVTADDMPRSAGGGFVEPGGPFEVMQRHLGALSKAVGPGNLLASHVSQIANGQSAIVLEVKRVTPDLMRRVPDKIEGVPVEVVAAGQD